MNYKYKLSQLYITVLICLTQVIYAGTYKWVRIGNVEMKVVDNTDQDQLSGSRAVYYYYDNYQSFHLDKAGWHVGTTDWVDDTGTNWPIKVGGTATAGANENITMPIADD